MKIIPYNPLYAEDFKRLNVEWLEKYFWVEPHDEEVLGKPEEYILKPGGAIFFIQDDDQIVGTVALMKMEEDVFELTKMAVTPSSQGKKYGQQLLQYTLDFAREKNWKKLIIYSNRKLENAIYLYRKFGFEEIPLENNPYARGDIKMELIL